MSEPAPQQEVDENDENDENDEQEAQADEDDYGCDETLAPSAQFGGMLDAILSNYFEYEAGDGSTLNIADILLLIRQSIDANTAALQALAAKR
jgi:hypothetical protein